MRTRMNPERVDRLARLQEATGEKTKAGAIDVGVKHYPTDLRAKRDVGVELDDELVDRISTPWLPIERATTVGRTS
ncbi:MAG TPA: hypothetical protein VKA37_04030, partial [Halobacteriales archaeon]|nr:hypothetical protein [Halobacteriales archaeon]